MIFINCLLGIDIQALNEKRLKCQLTFFIYIKWKYDLKWVPDFIWNLQFYRKDPEVLEWIGVLKEKYNGKKLVVARDKLDYVKGVRQKMLAFEIFLTRHPEWQGKVSLNKYRLLKDSCFILCFWLILLNLMLIGCFNSSSTIYYWAKWTAKSSIRCSRAN